MLAVHSQTISLIHGLSMTWPSSAETVMLPFDILGGNLGWLQAECLLDSSSTSSLDVPLYYIVSFFKLSAVGFAYVLFAGARLLLPHGRVEDLAHKRMSKTSAVTKLHLPTETHVSESLT